MTIAVPLFAAKLIRDKLDTGLVADPADEQKSLYQLIEFAEHFALKPLPGMDVVPVAGEIPEIRLDDTAIEAEEIGLIRLNGRVYVPETLEVEEPLHVAGNGQTLTLDMVDEILEELEPNSDPARLIDFLVHVIREDKPLLENELRPTAALSLAEALVGYETIVRRSDSYPDEPGSVVITFNNPRSSWQLVALLQQAVAGNGQ